MAYVAGKDIPMGDCLSRGQVCSVHLGIDCAAMAKRANGNIQAFQLAATELRLKDVTSRTAVPLSSVMSPQAKSVPWFHGWLAPLGI